MTLDDTIKQVLELDEKAMKGPWTDFGTGQTVNTKLACNYRTSAPLLARACQRMKEVLEEIGMDEDAEIVAAKQARAALADIEAMFEEGK